VAVAEMVPSISSLVRVSTSLLYPSPLPTGRGRSRQGTPGIDDVHWPRFRLGPLGHRRWSSQVPPGDTVRVLCARQ
jgi:hypothetical protein